MDEVAGPPVDGLAVARRLNSYFLLLPFVLPHWSLALQLSRQLVASPARTCVAAYLPRTPGGMFRTPQSAQRLTFVLGFRAVLL